MNFKQISVSCSLLVLFVSGSVMLGWCLHNSFLVQVLPGLNGMVFNAALSFFLLGVFLLLCNFHCQHVKYIKKMILGLVAFIAIISLMEDLFIKDFWIDHLFSTAWFVDSNPSPGRMAPNSAIAFLCSSAIGFMLPYGRYRIIAMMIQLLTFTIIVISILGLLVGQLGLEFILTDYPQAHMAIHTAVCFALLGFAWGSYWRRLKWYAVLYRGNEDKRIIFITAALVFCITLVAGLGSIAALSYQNLISIHKTIQSNLDSKIAVFVSSIEGLEEDISFLLQSSKFISSVQTSVGSHQGIQDGMRFLQTRRLSGIEISDAKGVVLAKHGVFIKSSVLSLPLKASYQMKLSWDKVFYIQFLVPIEKEGQVVGYLKGEKPLHKVDVAMTDYKNLGETGEVVVCGGLHEMNAECFPTRYSPHPFKVHLVQNNRILPMYYALIGKSGMMNAVDYRHDAVVAMFYPLGESGLGIVYKIDAKEIYQSVKTQIRYFLPLSIMLILTALFLLHWQVAPLVRKVIRSEKQAKENEEKLEYSEARLQNLNKKLQLSLQRLGERNGELLILKEFNSLLQACYTMDEAKTVISKYGELLFAGSSGVLYLLQAPDSPLEKVVSWGNPVLGNDILHVNTCWALRRHELHYYDQSKKSITCPHSVSYKNVMRYICVPLQQQDEVIGLLYIELTDREDEWESLASALSAQLGLAISNIKLNEKLRFQSIRDSLTGLFNRRYLEDIFESELERMATLNLTLSVIMLDIDFFKNFNDTYGHDLGDKVLRSVGTVIQNLLQDQDIACRYGGEEFLIILPATEQESAMVRAHEIQSSIGRIEIIYQERMIRDITVSLGLAMYPLHASNASDLILDADIALYQAKNSGRNKLVIYSQKD